MTQPSETWLDQFLFGIKVILSEGVALVQQRARLNFIGATVLDNPTTKCTDVTIAGGPPSGGAGGDLDGNYPNPVVQSIFTGIESGSINAEIVEWFAPDGDGAASISQVKSWATTDATPLDVRAIGTTPNVGYAIDVIATASKAGDGAGVGSAFNVWKASALVTKVSGASVIVDQHVSSVVLGGSNGWGGITFVASSFGFVRVFVTGAAATSLKWTVKTEITLR